MNIERMTKLAEALESETELERMNFRFKMSTLLRNKGEGCGSAGCIAGLAQVLFLDKRDLPDYDTLAETLGLTSDDAHHLFQPDETLDEDGDEFMPFLDEVGVYTAERAARVIRLAIEGISTPWAKVLQADEVIGE